MKKHHYDEEVDRRGGGEDDDEISGIFDTFFEVPEDRNNSFATARVQESPAMDESFYSATDDLSARIIGDKGLETDTDESLLVDHSCFEDADSLVSFENSGSPIKAYDDSIDQQIEILRKRCAVKKIQRIVRRSLLVISRTIRDASANKLQTIWRRYRRELAIVDRMLVGWWMKCDYKKLSHL